MDKRMSDDATIELAELEDHARGVGYNYPIAWALGFLVDNDKLLVRLLEQDGKADTADSLKRLVQEIRTGAWE